MGVPMPKPGGTVARGYGPKHKKARAAMKLWVDTGLASCTRCGRYIDPHEPWDADHTEDRTDYRGPAHRTCNRRAGGIKGNLRSRKLVTARRWVL